MSAECSKCGSDIYNHCYSCDKDAEIDRLRAKLTYQVDLTDRSQEAGMAWKARAEKAEARLARCTCGAIDVRAAATGDTK